MPDSQLPHNIPEDNKSFLRRTALELAEIEFRRNLMRDDPTWLQPDEGPEAKGSVECLMICYRVYSKQATCGRTLTDRAEAHRFLETMLSWTQGKLVYDGEGDDFSPHWRHAMDPPDDPCSGETTSSSPS